MRKVKKKWEKREGEEDEEKKRAANNGKCEESWLRCIIGGLLSVFIWARSCHWAKARRVLWSPLELSPAAIWTLDAARFTHGFLLFCAGFNPSLLLLLLMNFHHFLIVKIVSQLLVPPPPPPPQQQHQQQLGLGLGWFFNLKKIINRFLTVFLKLLIDINLVEKVQKENETKIFRFVHFSTSHFSTKLILNWYRLLIFFNC